MAELLTLFACINGTGCSETSSLYYSQHPAFSNFMKEYETKAKDMAGPILVNASTYALILGGQKSTFKLTGDIYLDYSLGKQALVFRREF